MSHGCNRRICLRRGLDTLALVEILKHATKHGDGTCIKNKKERNSTFRPNQSINISRNYVSADYSTSTFSTVKPD